MVWHGPGHAYDASIMAVVTSIPDVRVSVARSAAEVELMSAALEAAGGDNIDADPVWLLTVAAHLEGVLGPHVTRIEREGLPDVFVVARLEERRLETRLGGVAISRPRVRRLSVSFGGVIGAATEADARLVVEVMEQALAAGEADAVVFAKVPVDGVLVAAARDVVPRRYRDRAAVPVANWRGSLPDTFDEFMARRSKKRRASTRRSMRKLEEEFGDDLRLRRYTAEPELDELCRELEVISQSSYQRSLGAGFDGSDLQRALLRTGLRRGWCRAWVLALAGRPVAYWSGTSYRGTFVTDSPGFDPEYREKRVGEYVMLRMIEDLCADPDLTTLDFGWGDAEYKRWFSDDSRDVVDVCVFARSPRGARLASTRAAVSGADGLARRIVARVGVEDRLRRAKRRRAARDD